MNNTYKIEIFNSVGHLSSFHPLSIQTEYLGKEFLSSATHSEDHPFSHICHILRFNAKSPTNAVQADVKTGTRIGKIKLFIDNLVLLQSMMVLLIITNTISSSLTGPTAALFFANHFIQLSSDTWL